MKDDAIMERAYDLTKEFSEEEVIKLLYQLAVRVDFKWGRGGMVHIEEGEVLLSSDCIKSCYWDVLGNKE